MANASTVRRQVAGTQQLTIAPISGTTITTTETAFQLNNNGLTLTGGGVIPLSAGVTGLYAGTGQVLRVSAAGTVTGATAASTTLDLKLYVVPAALLPIADTLAGAQTFTNWTKIADSGALAISQTQAGFTLDARVQLSANGNLTGEFTSCIDFATVAAWAKLSTDVTGLVGEADLNFALTVTLGGTEAGVIVTLDEFRIDLE
jgi:hypothetical protein